jgi:hypothetical protein
VQLPPAQLPALAKVRSVLASRQFAAGGVLQVTAWQGLFAHAPLAHPNAHVESEGVYAHAPPEQVPALEKERSVVGSVQKLAGGDAHVMPAHGSLLHAPFTQVPASGHAMTFGRYSQLPCEHRPRGDDTCKPPSTQVGTGGVAHVTPWHGLPTHRPPAHPLAHGSMRDAYAHTLSPLQVPWAL